MTEQTADKLTILVVDDSRLMRVAARKILKDDFDILEAADGEQAWDMLQSSPQVNLIMSDLSMPNLDGLGLLKRVREAEQTGIKTLPVIIVTGAEDDDGSKQTALSAGASDFITKPFESIQLLARAKTQAKQQQTQQALQDSEASKQQLEQHSSVDILTGLANERDLIHHIESGLSYALRHRTELSLLLVQADKYKVMFLRRGKQAAEEILRGLAGMLSEGRRREDVVARTGLDTFGILLPSANSIGARRVAEQLLDAIRSHDFGIDDDKIPVRISIGVSSPAINHEVTAAGMLEDARQKLRLAAAAGGDCVQHELQPADSTAPSAAAPARTASPAVAAEPASQASAGAPLIASVAAVENALQLLASGRRCEQETAPLARAVLPLLHAWNRAQDNQHSALIHALEAALKQGEDAPVRVPADAF